MKKYKILLQNSHEYDLEIYFDSKYNKFIDIYYSNEDFWNDHIKGKLAIRLENTGNNIKISGFKINKILEYDKAMLLNFVLTLENKVDYNTGEFKEIPDNEIYQVVEEKVLMNLI